MKIFNKLLEKVNDVIYSSTSEAEIKLARDLKEKILENQVSFLKIQDFEDAVDSIYNKALEHANDLRTQKKVSG